MLEAAGADDVVAATENEEGGGVGAKLRDVVSGEAVGADVGRGDDKAVALVGLEGDSREGGVALAAMGAADAAQGGFFTSKDVLYQQHPCWFSRNAHSSGCTHHTAHTSRP